MKNKYKSSEGKGIKEIKSPPKIKKLGCCNDCGKMLFGITKETLDYQKKHIDNEFVRVSCDECISKNHTLTDEELSGVKKLEFND